MQTRTRHSTARFLHSFEFTGIDRARPAGENEIDDDEQCIEGIAWRRVATFMHLPAEHDGTRSRQMLKIDHAELKAALELDRQYPVATTKTLNSE